MSDVLVTFCSLAIVLIRCCRKKSYAWTDADPKKQGEAATIYLCPPFFDPKGDMMDAKNDLPEIDVDDWPDIKPIKDEDKKKWCGPPMQDFTKYVTAGKLRPPMGYIHFDVEEMGTLTSVQARLFCMKPPISMRWESKLVLRPSE